MNPEVRRGLRVILVERPPGAVAPGLHAQKDHATAVGEDRPGLPGGLAGLVELEVPQAAPVGVHEGRLALRREEEPVAPRGFSASAVARGPRENAGENGEKPAAARKSRRPWTSIRGQAIQCRDLRA